MFGRAGQSILFGGESVEAMSLSPFFESIEARASAAPPAFEEAEFSYELLRSGPAVSAHELESSSEQELEVIIHWQGNVLHVAHLSSRRGFSLGEPEPHLKTTVDFVLPAELLGMPHFELVSWAQGQAFLNLPSQASGCVDSSEQGRTSLDDIERFGGVRATASQPGSLPLAAGLRARLWLGRFEIEAALVPSGRKLKRLLFESDSLALAQATALTALTFGSLLGALAFFVPPLGVNDEEALQKKRLVMVQQYLAALAEREPERTPNVGEPNTAPSGGTGERHQGESGALGQSQSQAKNKRYQVQAPAETPEPHLARQSVRELVANFGLVGMLNASSASLSPNSPFGRDAALGADPMNAMGNMWGAEPGEAFGIGGLDVSGTGDGGGGPGKGIGMGPLGSLGSGSGLGDGDDFGNGKFARSRGLPGLEGHPPRTPRVRVGPTSVSGRLPAEVIQRIVRQNFGRFRLCYEDGLRRNPNLEGRVSVRFAIGRDGNVLSSGLGGSDLPDSQVASCVVAAFYGLGFPKPEGGIVSVAYPIMFAAE